MNHAAECALKSLLVTLSLKFSLWFLIHWVAKVRKVSCLFEWRMGQGRWADVRVSLAPQVAQEVQEGLPTLPLFF